MPFTSPSNASAYSYRNQQHTHQPDHHPFNQPQRNRQQCSQCEHWVLPSDRFCEVCGNAIGRAPCRNCGASADQTDDEGFCIECGFRKSQTEDQRELILSEHLAAGSDRGLHHPINQDAFALAQLPGSAITDQRTLLVVCDGISSSPRAELASQTAATIMVNSIIAAASDDRRDDGPNDGPPTDLAIAPAPACPAQVWLARSLRQAQREVMTLASPNVDSPSTTVISAIVESALQDRHQPKSSQPTKPDRITLAWLGDSRAYWLSPQSSYLLSQDHKNEQGAVTRWLGNDADLNQDPPQFKTFYPPEPGYLLLCSDGLWNYAPHPQQMRALLQTLETSPHTAQPTSTASLIQSLIQFAKQQGGHDNITAALQKIP